MNYEFAFIIIILYIYIYIYILKGIYYIFNHFEFFLDNVVKYSVANFGNILFYLFFSETNVNI